MKLTIFFLLFSTVYASPTFLRMKRNGGTDSKMNEEQRKCCEKMRSILCPIRKRRSPGNEIKNGEDDVNNEKHRWKFCEALKKAKNWVYYNPRAEEEKKKNGKQKKGGGGGCCDLDNCHRQAAGAGTGAAVGTGTACWFLPGPDGCPIPTCNPCGPCCSLVDACCNSNSGPCCSDSCCGGGGDPCCGGGGDPCGGGGGGDPCPGGC